MPFSCVVARTSDGRIVAESLNLVQQTSDPTAHAEILAVRQACQRLGSPSLEGHEVYALAYPCPMCLGALYYASPDRVVFVVTREEEGRHYRDEAFAAFGGPIATVHPAAATAPRPGPPAPLRQARRPSRRRRQPCRKSQTAATRP